jgi:hypothetical protein
MLNKILSIGIAIALSGCHKAEVEPVEPAKKDFTVGYFFINKGDSNIDKVSLQTETFYPNVDGRVGYNSQQTFSKLYESVGARDSIAHLFTGQYMKKTLYPGCITYMRVVLLFKTPVYVPYPYTTPANPPRGGYRTRIFELPPDTVTAAANCTRTFRWPVDTLRYKELPAYR